MNRLFCFRYLVCLTGVVYLAAFLYFQRWDRNIISGGDTWGYYAYLPATFIHGDLANIDSSYLLRFNYWEGTPQFPGAGGELPIADNGHRVIKYTCGVALLELPFFAMGHAWALLDYRYEADGFSFPYRFLVHLAPFFYLFFGGFLLFRLLAAETSPRTAFWVIMILLLGTPLFNSIVYRGPMAHGYLFACYGALLYASWQFYRRPSWKVSLLLGLSVGLIGLMRPVEVVCVLIPALYGLSSWQGVRQRFVYWWEQRGKLSVAVAIALAIVSLQFLYWQYATGQWFFDSYPGEDFDFANPRIWDGLFSYQNGWLVYAPIMILALLGCGFLFRRRDWLWPVFTVLPLHIFIAYSWWCWNYINGFGSRPMVEISALLAIPLAYLWEWGRSRAWLTYALSTLALLAIGLQLFQNWQHSKGLLWTENANAAYYWSVFGKTSMTYDALVAFDSGEHQVDSTRLSKHKTLMSAKFESLTDSTLVRDDSIVYEGKHALRLSPDNKFYTIWDRSLEEAGAIAGDWIRISAWCYKEVREEPWYTAPSIVVSMDSDGESLIYRQVRIDSKLANPSFSLWGGRTGHWGWVRMWVQVPKEIKPSDLLKVYVMAERQRVYIDDVELTVWK